MLKGKNNFFVIAGQVVINLGTSIMAIGARQMGAPDPLLATYAVQAQLFQARLAQQAQESLKMLQAANEEEKDDLSEGAAELAAEIRRRLARKSRRKLN